MTVGVNRSRRAEKNFDRLVQIVFQPSLVLAFDLERSSAQLANEIAKRFNGSFTAVRRVCLCASERGQGTDLIQVDLGGVALLLQADGRRDDKTASGPSSFEMA